MNEPDIRVEEAREEDDFCLCTECSLGGVFLCDTCLFNYRTIRRLKLRMAELEAAKG